jgi:hypothetical protein
MKQLFLFLLVLSVACSKEKEPTYLKEELLALAPAEGADKIEVVLARDINDAVPCADYGDGCLSAHRFRTRGLGFIAVEFSTPAEAESAAKKIYGYTARNWLLDDIDGEPTLERWAVEHLKAKSFNPVKKKAADSAETPAESESTSPATHP